MTTTWHVNRLSVEWVGPVTVAVNGTPVTGWTYALLPLGQAPATATDIATAPTTLDGGLGVLVGPGTDHDLEPGEHVLWVRYVDDPESVVLPDAGRITIHRGAAA
jgi:hypothetical protein